jgi:glycosyltransferase A (GT-A) superfamily protein (DUF2064 family)
MVKTRLVPPLGQSDAAHLAEAMLRDVVGRCSASRLFETVLVFSPLETLSWFQDAFGCSLPLRPQRGAGLGERMASFFRAELGRGPGRTAVVVGGNAPLLPLRRIEQAHEALAAGCDLVLVPDQAGGACLIGLSRPAERLFSSVQMPEEGMLERTLVLAHKLGLDPLLLENELGVDLYDDLLELERRISLAARGPDFPSQTWRWLEERARR